MKYSKNRKCGVDRMQKIKLFCLPYAGGSATFYSKWKKFLHDSIELYPVELAGRGRRSKEPFYESVNDAVDDIYRSIEGELDDTEFIFFGHSMGSVLVYELMYKIKELKNKVPAHAFFSGRYPPHIKRLDKIFHKMPEEEFIDEIYKIGGMQKEFFEHRELLDVFVPIIKADYKIIEEYNHVSKSDRLNIDITVFNGTQDKDVIPDDLKEWHSITDRECDVIEFEGGHFFIFHKHQEIVDIINHKTK